MKYSIIFIFFITGLLAQDKVKEDKFLKLKVSNAQVQSEIDALRKNYLIQKKDIVAGYKERIKSLKTMQKSDIKSLKKSFRERLRELRKKHKDVKFPEKPKKKEKPLNMGNKLKKKNESIESE